MTPEEAEALAGTPSHLLLPLEYVMDEIRVIVNEDIFVSEERIRQRILPCIVIVNAVLTIIYLAFTALAERVISDQSKLNKRKFCYQATNLCANLSLGLLGFYYEFVLLPQNATIRVKIQGSEEFYILAAAQIGYQLWGIPMGVFYVEETFTMILHHVSVIFVSAMSAFLHNGFRYWTPFFYGIVEISSVPLAIMNGFKNNPAWIENHPTAYLASRLTFSFVFLIVRIWMLVPRHLEYLRDCFLVPYLTDPKNSGYKAYMYACFVSSAFLLFLQLYWGFLIVKGLVTHFFVKKKPEKKVD